MSTVKQLTARRVLSMIALAAVLYTFVGLAETLLAGSPDEIPPSAVQGLIADKDGSGDLVLSWTPVNTDTSGNDDMIPQWIPTKTSFSGPTVPVSVLARASK